MMSDNGTLLGNTKISAISRVKNTLKLVVPAVIMQLFAVAAFAQQNNGVAAAEYNPADSTYTSLTFSPGTQVSAQQAAGIFSRYMGIGNNTTMVLANSTKTKLGITSDRYTQYYKGIKVELSSATITSNNGVAGFVTSNYYKITNDMAAVPSLAESDALPKALGRVGAQKYMWQDSAMERKLKLLTKNPDTTHYPKGTLVWIEDMEQQVTDRKLHLAYAFNIYALQPLSRDMVYVDANTGKILLVNPLIENTAATGNSLYSGPLSFQAKLSGSSYILEDATRGSGVNTYDCAGGDGSAAVNITSGSTTFPTNAALDAHWGAEKVYDYWLTQQGRNSYDNAAGAINSFVHYMSGYNNAFWDGYEMIYGDGTGIASGGFSPLVSLDVCAHEIGHGVCQHTAGLVYNKESGAMNEGFSDIWGAVIENYANPHETDAVAKNMWAIGEEISSSSLRRMDNPNLKGQPDTYGGSYWYGVSSCTPTSSNDYCGVHQNSGVLNYWFYLMCQGGSGTNDIGNAFAVTGIGAAKGAAIAYQTELVLTSTATFASCRTASINAATVLYGACSPEVQAVTKAWYAVGVGANFTGSVAAITGAATLCSGATTTLADATAGGTWSSSNSAIAGIGATTGVVTGATAGAATITYTTGGTCSATKAITVNATPSAISGTATVCAGATTALSNTVAGGTWSSSNAAVAMVGATGAVTGVSAGTATITYTTGAGCYTSKAVTVNALPVAGTISGGSSVTTGSATALTASVGGGIWSSSNAAIATVSASGIVTGIATGTAVITYTVSNGCGSAYTTTTITVTASNHPPVFTGGASQSMTACQGSGAAAINTLLSASDADAGQTLTWSVYSAPSHGTLSGLSATAVATTGALTPAGVAYTPTAGYSGTDAFVIKVSDGIATATITINVTINAAPVISGTASVCTGSATALTASATGGAWSSSNASVASVNTGGTVTGVAAGTAMITYAPASGCTGTYVVTVNPLPFAGTVSGSSSIATGASTSLTTSVSGGVWSSSNTAIAVVSTGGIVTGVAPGTANITYTVSNSCGSAYAVKTVTVATVVTNHAPAFTGGTAQSLTVCKNAAATSINTLLSVTDLDAGQTETWTLYTAPAHGTVTGLSTTAIATGGVVTPSGITYTPASGYSGADAFYIVVSDGIASAIITMNVTINPGPAISGASSVCAGGSTLLTSTATGGTWTSSNPGIAEAGTTVPGIVTGISAGVATITHTNAAGCKSVKTITVAPMPVAGTLSGATSVNTGVSTALAASVPGGTWGSSNIGIATVDGAGMVSGIAAGTVYISYTVTNGCGSAHATKQVTVRSASGVEDMQANGKLNIYPNPTTGSFTVTSQADGYLYLFSVDGRQVAVYKITNGANALSIPGGLPPGIYPGNFVSNDGSKEPVKIMYRP